MIKSERYGGGQRWYCDQCDVSDESTERTIVSWTNSKPPEICSRCIGTALAHYEARLAEETERFDVLGISDAGIENNSWKVVDPEEGAGQIWADLTKQSGLQLVVNWAPGNPRCVYAVLSKEPIPHPDHYYELWYIVQTLSDKEEDDGEKAEAIHLYEGPYKLEMELF